MSSSNEQCVSVCLSVNKWLNPFSIAWQQSERVSVRLAARETVLEPQQPTSHNARYAGSSYHTQPNVYSPQQFQSLPRQLVVPESTQTHLESASRLSTTSTTSSSSKRPLQEDESAQAPKPKRAKAKSKSATPGSTSASGAFEWFFLSLCNIQWYAPGEGVISLHCGSILCHFNFLTALSSLTLFKYSFVFYFSCSFRRSPFYSLLLMNSLANRACISFFGLCWPFRTLETWI